MIPERMASMVRAIELGMTLEQAWREGVVATPFEEEIWKRLAADVEAIKRGGGKVEIPEDPLV